MFATLRSFALRAGIAQRSARAPHAEAFARPTIEERLVRAFRRARRA